MTPRTARPLQLQPWTACTVDLHRTHDPQKPVGRFWCHARRGADGCGPQHYRRPPAQRGPSRPHAAALPWVPGQRNARQAWQRLGAPRCPPPPHPTPRTDIRPCRKTALRQTRAARNTKPRAIRRRAAPALPRAAGSAPPSGAASHPAATRLCAPSVPMPLPAHANPCGSG